MGVYNQISRLHWVKYLGWLLINILNEGFNIHLPSCAISTFSFKGIYELPNYLLSPTSTIPTSEVFLKEHHFMPIQLEHLLVSRFSGS